MNLPRAFLLDLDGNIPKSTASSAACWEEALRPLAGLPEVPAPDALRQAVMDHAEWYWGNHRGTGLPPGSGIRPHGTVGSIAELVP